MISYDEFENLAREFNIPSAKYLPEAFQNIKNDWEYTTKDVAELTGKSEISIRRWIRKGKLKAQRRNPYIVLGIDLKRMLFKDFYSHIEYSFRQLVALDDISVQRILKDVEI